MGGHEYIVQSWYHHLVATYANIGILQVGELNYIQYLSLRRDAFIHYLEQSDAGREYLDNAWRLTLTKPDRKGLRRKYGGGR